MPSANRVRNITVTSYSEAFEAVDARISYAVWQRERCPKTGRDHFQAYVEFKTQLAFSAAKEVFPGAHIEPARGTAAENQAYCTKDESRIDGPWTVGEPKRPGKRNDIDDAVVTLKEHGLKRVAEEHPTVFVKFHRGLTALRDILAPTPVDRPELIDEWYYGDTGTGKSRTVREKYGGSLYVKGKHKWWDGYETQETVLIEEVNPDFCDKFKDELKEWTDHYPFSVEVKGGVRTIRPPRLVFTSNFHPQQCFEGSQYLPPMLRRLRVQEVKKNLIHGDISTHGIPPPQSSPPLP